ncbi:MAG: AgmX/PglI C-terminal domain-containing protein [Polyangia bacterium]
MAQAKPRGSSADAPKILRIGIIQGEKIVEERLVRKRENVTVGQSAKNTFVVPASNALPRTFTLFELTPQGYALNFSDGMDGRISLGDSVVALPALRQAGKAEKKNGLYHVMLSEKSRGKIVIGDVKVLFQFVAPPPVQPRPQLPASVRSSTLQNLDWMLVWVLAASFLTHFAFVIYLRNVDFPRKPDIEELPDRFAQLIVPKHVEEKKVEEKKVDPNAEKKVEHQASSSQKSVSAPKAQKTEEEKAAEAAARRAALEQKIQSQGVLKILGAKGEGGGIADLLKTGDVSGDAGKVFNSVGGVSVGGESGAGGIHGKGTGGTGSAKGGSSLMASGPGTVGTGERTGEHAVRGTVKTSSAPIDADGTLDPSILVKEIRSHLGAITACYETGLKRNPNLSGKIQLRFEISAIGKVTSADIENDTMKDDEVAGCIKQRVLSWRLPAPKGGGSAQFSYPFIFQASK